LVYGLLNIEGLEERGESFYNPYLEGVCEALAVESNGAQAVFLPAYTNRDGSPLPLIVKKSDGGYNYVTMDLAAIRQRTSFPEGELAERVLYVTDAGQAQHFQMVFKAAEMAGFVPESVSLEHVPFG
jgi:arginyl-tRNA synthetase